MVRMAQDFAMRYELVDGQGNFGSIDGDAPAAMRYTEARMASIGEDLLQDIEKNTVDFEDNFDGTLQEPTVLPANFPNLLVNGASGIAVGMSTSIPPHNLGEVCDALGVMLDNWENMDDIGVPELMQFIKGPDFPTGGRGLYASITDQAKTSCWRRMATGRGKVRVRAKAHIEELGRGRSRIIVSEIPYQTNKTSLIERIADLSRGGAYRGHRRSARRKRPQRAAHRDRSHACGGPGRRAIVVVQANAVGEHVQHHHAGAGGWRTAPVEPETSAARVPGTPPGRGPAAQRVRSDTGARARAYPGRDANRAGQPG